MPRILLCKDMCFWLDSARRGKNACVDRRVTQKIATDDTAPCKGRLGQKP